MRDAAYQTTPVSSHRDAIAGGGLLGGVLLETLDVGSFPWALVGLLILSFVVALFAKDHGFAAANAK